VRIQEVRRPTVPRPLGSGTKLGSAGPVGSGVGSAAAGVAHGRAREMKVKTLRLIQEEDMSRVHSPC
jgi:hypothetical protein